MARVGSGSVIGAPWRAPTTQQVVWGYTVQGAAQGCCLPGGLGQGMSWAGLITACTRCQVRAMARVKHVLLVT